jgi:hypothetical protein
MVSKELTKNLLKGRANCGTCYFLETGEGDKEDRADEDGKWVAMFYSYCSRTQDEVSLESFCKKWKEVNFSEKIRKLKE